MRPRALAQAIPRGTDKPKPEVDQRKSPCPIALARLRHDGFALGGRPVSRKGDSQMVASRACSMRRAAARGAWRHRAAPAACRIGSPNANRIDSITGKQALDQPDGGTTWHHGIKFPAKAHLFDTSYVYMA